MSHTRVKQVSEAVPHKDHHFLCVVASSGTNIDVEAFKAKARFVVDIGKRFQPLWSEYLSMKSTLDLTKKTEAGLAIELSGQQVRFRVNEHVWSSGLDFTATLELLKSRLFAAKPLSRYRQRKPIQIQKSPSHHRKISYHELLSFRYSGGN